MIVNFWATWCAPCVAEMPSLQRLRDRMAPAGLEVIAVNLQENAARIQPYRRAARRHVSRGARSRRKRARRVGRRRVSHELCRRSGPAYRMVGQGRDRLGRRASRIASAQSSLMGQRVRAAAVSRDSNERKSEMDRRSFLAVSSALPFVSAFPLRRERAGAHLRAGVRRLADLRGHDAPGNRQRGRGHQGVDSGSRAQYRLAAVAGQHVVGQPARRRAVHRPRVRREDGARDLGRRRIVTGDRSGQPHPHPRPRHRLEQEIGAGGERRRPRPQSQADRAHSHATASWPPRPPRRSPARPPTSTRRARCTTGS